MGIEIIHVSKKIGKNEVLKNINMTLEYGKIYGLQGRNGSGKTMLIRTIAGLILPSEGEIKIDDFVLHKEIRFPKSVGVIIETPGFWDYYTGFENLKALAMINNSIGDEQILKTLEIVGLFEAKDVKYKKYSLGMKQRLAIAQAIMEEPKILLLDEPTNSLDQDGIDMLRTVLKKFKEERKLIVIASHIQEDIELLADIKYSIKSGEIGERCVIQHD